ncbi:MAG TPA: trehalose-phosphatase [Methylocella sp.]
MQPGDLARIAPCSACAYFLDADGTLLDMMPRPEDVVADETLRRLLAELAGAARGALALVSGCTIEDIDRIIAPPKLVLRAMHTIACPIRRARVGAPPAFAGRLNSRDRAIAPLLPAFAILASSAGHVRSSLDSAKRLPCSTDRGVTGFSHDPQR